MESSEDEVNAIEAFTSGSRSAQKSPIAKFLDTLSPIGTVQYPRRLSELSSLFLQGETGFHKREKTVASSSNVHGKCDTKQFQSCNPSESTDEYLTGKLPADTAKQHAETCLQSVKDVPQQLPSCFRASEVTNEKIVDANDFLVGVEPQPLLPGSFSLLEVSDSLSVQKIEYHKEASQHHIRRHLQFEDVLDYKGEDAFNLHTSAAPRTAVSSLIEPIEVSNANSYDPTKAAVVPSDSVSSTENAQNQGISALVLSQSDFPLNNVAKSVYVGSDVFSSQKWASLHSSQENHIHIRSNYSVKHTNDPLMLTGQEVIDLADSNNQSCLPDVVGDQLPERADPPWESQQVSSFELQIVPRDGNMPGIEFAEMVEEQSQSQDKWKRKRETYTDKNKGCKRCNCKRSKCLKLYCECFAAGVYCVESCACENCLNKPDYEDTVSGTREQIESRNPLAFAPTIVEQNNDSPNVADDGRINSPTARHKRGCKCRRSKCLKKYCECYRAKVGCCDGCRCESCDNSFGKKLEIVVQRAEKWKNLSHEKLNTAEVMPDGINGVMADQLSSTWDQLVYVNPFTPPLLQHPHSTAVRSLPSPNMGDCSDFSPAHQSQSRRGLQLLLPDQLHWSSPTLSPMPGCPGRFSHDLSSTGGLCTIQEDCSSDILMDNCHGQIDPTYTEKSISSSNHHISSLHNFNPYDQAQPDHHSGNELILQAVALHSHHNSQVHMMQAGTSGNAQNNWNTLCISERK